MASNFDRWEKDPFFSAAEEVQDSADRMESAYRRWIHERKGDSEVAGDHQGFLRRELHTALGTAKWQLEEFERAVQLIDQDQLGEDARARHRQFIVAIENQVTIVENSLRESVLNEGDSTLPWVRLDKGEQDELAVFLLGSSPDEHEIPMRSEDNGREQGDDSGYSVELGSVEMRGEKNGYGHRRTESVGADVGDWKIIVADDNGPPDMLSPPMIDDFSSVSGGLDSKPKLKWLKNNFRKWKGADHNALRQGIDACYERSKSCLDSCDIESYDKDLNGWVGSVQRQLQRSQYQIQYGRRPIQVTFWVVLALLLIVYLCCL